MEAKSVTSHASWNKENAASVAKREEPETARGRAGGAAVHIGVGDAQEARRSGTAEVGCVKKDIETITTAVGR